MELEAGQSLVAGDVVLPEVAHRLKLKGSEMNRMKCLILAVTLCALLVLCPQAESEHDPDGEEESAVTIVLTGLDVNDATLELSWKITNNTDHDVWICSSLNVGTQPVYEVFLDKDAETLMIRRRFGLPIEEGITWEFPFRKGQYVRLHSGQEKAESLSIPLPVRPYNIFGHLHANAEYARRLALEIGFFNEDLQELILRTVELAEIIHNLDPNLPAGYVWDSDLVNRFFVGWSIIRNFNHDLMFQNSVTSGEGPIVMPYMAEKLRERFLRIEVDGVSIPYESNYPPLTGQGTKSTKDQQSRQISNHKKDKIDREKG
jgi:hypothetical protein